MGEQSQPTGNLTAKIIKKKPAKGDKRDAVDEAGQGRGG